MSIRPFTLVALGDCNTCGLCGADGQIVPDLVVAGLRARGLGCEFVNLGLTMSTTREGLARLRDQTRSIDLLLVNFGLVDAWTTSLPGLYLSYYPDHWLKSCGRRLLKWGKRYLRSPVIRRWLPVGEVVSLSEYESNLRQIMTLAQTRSPQVRIVLWGTAPVRDDPPRNQMIQHYNKVMQKVAESSHGVQYYHTPDALSGHALDEVLLDVVHLNAYASERIATGILAVWDNFNSRCQTVPIRPQLDGGESAAAQPDSKCA